MTSAPRVGLRYGFGFFACICGSTSAVAAASREIRPQMQNIALSSNKLARSRIDDNHFLARSSWSSPRLAMEADERSEGCANARRTGSEERNPVQATGDQQKLASTNVRPR